jgi:hypothetical protein
MFKIGCAAMLVMAATAAALGQTADGPSAAAAAPDAVRNNQPEAMMAPPATR